MGSKIPKALLPEGVFKTAIEYEKRPTGELHCPTPGCGALLSFVERHDRKYVDKTIHISPTFPLRPKQVHVSQCRYDLSGQVSIIAKSSESEVFKSISNNQYEFRLHILTKAMIDYNNQEKRAREGLAARNTPNKKYSNSGKLSNYLKTLRQILELRSLCDNNSDLKDLIKLKKNGKTLPWKKFFFDHTNLETFIAEYGIGKYTVPLAICGYIKEIQAPNEKLSSYVIELNSPFVKSDAAGVIHKPIPRIFFRDDELVKQIDKDKEYIFFGSWKASLSPWKSQNDVNWSFQNIDMHISHADQFIDC